MSDRMSVTYAQTYLDTWSTGDSVDMWKVRAARTVVAQAEQIERLQAALSEADRNWYDALSSEYEYTCKQEGFISTYESLLPGDMEPPA